MIQVADIYKASHDGLDIILDYYPQAADCVDTKKKFKRRLDEDDASACIRKYNDCYKVTDFGDQGQAMSPIDICMYEENCNFTEALYKLAAKYNVSSEINKTINKPDIRKRPATEDEKEGDRKFELESQFTEAQLKVLGPRVKQEHCDALNWYIAKWISYTKNRETTIKSSTENYPIFMRECTTDEGQKFYKIYEPINPDKQWRFSYTPEGVKPKQYINGLAELRKLFQDMNAADEKLFFSDPKNEGKPYKEEKLKEAFICSGERDSLCLKSLNYIPLWFNSETYKITPEEIKEIYKYVEVIYNIPDIDSTGRAKGTELALKYMDIHTVWLPEWLSHYRDMRGKPRKDLRDYCELRPKYQDFRNLLALSMPARFWVQTINERTRKASLEVDADCLHYFLKLNGFYSLRDENSSTTKYVRLNGNIVEPVSSKDINKFLRKFAKERYLSRDIRNLILNSPRMSDAALERLEEITIDFTNYTPHSQFLFFPKVYWEVTRKGITEKPANSVSDRYVWDHNVIQHNVTVLPPMFTITNEQSEHADHFNIDIHEKKCCMLNYLINTSRTHWRKELEYQFEDHQDSTEALRYRTEHLFDIAGPVLNQAEVREQKLNLINKIFAIGYMLHRYKSPSQAWAPYAMDNKIGEDGDCNGRSGKSFLFKAFDYFMSTVKLSGRNPRLMDNPHVFDQVDQHTDMILVDDCDKYLSMGLFYDCITTDMTINPKNNKSFNIPFTTSPKFAFTTNYVPTDFDPSTNARLIFMVFSDYYHQKTVENDYLETRSIRDDFNKNLLTDYSEAEWNLDINFFAQCLQFYLQFTERATAIQPPMENILKRKFKADMGTNFEDWAYTYFAQDSENVNALVAKEKAFEEYRRFSGINKWTMQKFTKALKGFVALCPYIETMNPEEFRNSSGRIVRKVEGKSVDMIYLKTFGAEISADDTAHSLLFTQVEDDGRPF